MTCEERKKARKLKHVEMKKKEQTNTTVEGGRNGNGNVPNNHSHS